LNEIRGAHISFGHSSSSERKLKYECKAVFRNYRKWREKETEEHYHALAYTISMGRRVVGGT
jgi:hypothetical protein